MKKSILLALLMSTVLGASAQWVTIPDDNFAAKLNQLYPECMDGNQMDTECFGIEYATSLDVRNSGISDLYGVEYFDNLQILQCDTNYLTQLPELPATLTVLRCSDNNLTSLSELPTSLTTLYCPRNELNSLPELPDGLATLHCHSNNLTSLPNLPSALGYLSCRENQLSSLPELPQALEQINCSNNNLTSLPDLPSSLWLLMCYQNNLVSLPDLPPSLSVLHCSINEINILPDLPENLNTLRCRYNNLTSLPELPELYKLVCNNNQITCLPTLPMTLTNQSYTHFEISSNPITCVPNYVPAMPDSILSYPLCNLSDVENNPYGCNSLDGVAGLVFLDSDENCEFDEEEAGPLNIPVKLLDSANEPIATTYTLSNSFYNFSADTGVYTVQLMTESMPFQVSCDDPGNSQGVELTSNEPSAFDVDFGVECGPGFDVGVQSVVTTGWVFPGEMHTLKLVAGEMTNWFGLQCAQGISGTVSVQIDGPVNYVGPATNALTPTITDELQLTYSISNFDSVNFHTDFAMMLETETTAQSGDLVCIFITMNPFNGDINLENNSFHHCYEVVNSVDPNIKQVWPQDVEPGYDDYFNYTIYFQNTGNAPAFNIEILDTLDSNLDWSTFELTGYSHDCYTTVTDSVARFYFNNIMLLDSSSDFEGSIGYVQYRLKPLADMPVGTVIENTAHIFFDFNDAIVTNTTQNEFVIDTGLNGVQQQLATVFPNPGNGQFNVLLRGVENGLTTHLEVYNLSGQRVLQLQVNENRITLDLTDYRSGMYLLHVRNERGSEAIKLMKQ